jgi:16S rRNA processing protein RimM
MSRDGLLSAGRVGRPHGLDGSVHVTRPRSRLLRVGGPVVVAGARRAIVRLAGTDARPIVRLEGCEARETVEALRGEELLVPRDATPPLGEDEWLAEDLEGCAVVDGATPVGVVAGLLAYPSCELLEVAREDRPPLLVPLVGDAVRSVDVDARRIDVDLGFLGEEA